MAGLKEFFLQAPECGLVALGLMDFDVAGGKGYYEVHDVPGYNDAVHLEFVGNLNLEL